MNLKTIAFVVPVVACIGRGGEMDYASDSGVVDSFGGLSPQSAHIMVSCADESHCGLAKLTATEAPTGADLMWVIDGKLANGIDGKTLNVLLIPGHATMVELTVSMRGDTVSDSVVLVPSKLASWDSDNKRVVRSDGTSFHIVTRDSCTVDRLEATTTSIGGCFTGQQSIVWSIAEGTTMPSYQPGGYEPSSGPKWLEVATFDPPNGDQSASVHRGPWDAIRAKGPDWAARDNWSAGDASAPGTLPFAQLKWQGNEENYLFQAWVRDAGGIIAVHDSPPVLSCDDDEISVDVDVLPDDVIGSILNPIYID